MSSPARSPRKSWTFSMAQSESMHALLEMAIEPLETCALVLPDGKTLHMKPSSPADLATLPQAALLCHQYLKLKHRDLAIVNDPYSGGTTLSEITIVAGVCFETAGPEAEILLAARIKLPVRLPEGPRIDDEGVRIPPMPLATAGRLNLDLLRAICAHPMAPKGLETIMQSAAQEIDRVIARLKNLGGDPAGEFKKANFKRYLSDSSRAFQGWMSRLPLGATTVVAQLSPGRETLKLQLEITEKALSFNFAGTDASDAIALTEVATLGACVAATAAALNIELPLNSGIFEHFQVSTPAKTLLSARAPQGTFRGMHFGISAVANLVGTALAKLKPTSFQAGDACGSEGFFQIAFADGRVMSGRLAPGTGAHKDSDGVDAWATWGMHEGKAPSIEAMETEFPVTVVYGGIRTHSGGKGKRRGGHGSLCSLRMGAAGTLRWSLGPMTDRQDGASSGRAGLPAQVEVVRAGTTETEEFTTPEGSVQLGQGDVIRICTSGGGGFGEPEA